MLSAPLIRQCLEHRRHLVLYPAYVASIASRTSINPCFPFILARVHERALKPSFHLSTYVLMIVIVQAPRDPRPNVGTLVDDVPEVPR